MFIFLLFILILFFLEFRKKRDKVFNGIILALIGIVFSIQVFSRWSAIPDTFDNRTRKIVLHPNSEYKTNLVGHDFPITDLGAIDTLLRLLYHVELTSSRFSTIWTTEMTFYTDHDTVSITIAQSKDNGTQIENYSDRWRKDEVGAYLEKLTSYKVPVSKDSVLKAR